MSKLFALEEIEEIGVVDQLETNPEEGEVADVQSDMVGEIDSVETQVTAIDDGMGAADQLESVHEVVEASVEEGEGLSPIAAEAVRIAVEAICARVGANPKSMYALYATENFQSASSRKANSRIALESISDFLKNLWEKIKAAVSNIWTKVTEFWNKHVSNLGRVLKALESMKSKISATKGSPNQGSDEVKASSGLKNTFVGKGDISTTEIESYISTHTDCAKDIDMMLKATKDLLAPMAASATASGETETARRLRETLKKAFSHNNGPASFGSNDKPLAGGVFMVIEEEIDNVEKDDEDSISYSMTVNTETSDIKEEDRDLFIADKNKLKAVIASTITLIKATIKSRDSSDKAQKEFDKAKKEIDKGIGDMKANTSIGKDRRRKAGQALRTFATINSNIPTIAVKLASRDVLLAKGVLEYCGTCLRNYK